MTSDPLSEPRWSVLLPFLTCGILPATTARRTNHVSLRQAYVVHLVAALLVVIAEVLSVSWEYAPIPATFASIGQQVVINIDWFVGELARGPKTIVLIILGIALLIEVVFVGLAYLVMPWGACDEPLGASFRHALRRVWLQTPHIVLIGLLVDPWLVPLQRMERSWNTLHPIDIPPAPTMPADLQVETPAWDEYNQQMQEYWTEVGRLQREARLQQPWYLCFSEAINVAAFFFLCLWLLWGLLRSVGAPRVVPPIPRPPRCDACGYNLKTIPLESRCPECGEPVAASLGPDARPGPPWKRRREIGRFAAWRRCRVEAIRDPARFGRTLRLTTPGVDHRRFLVIHLPFVFLIGAASPLAMFWAVEHRSPFPNEAEVVLLAGPLFGTLCTVGVLAVSLLSAAVAGLFHHFRDRRNLLVGAVQVVSYLVVYLVVWQVFGAATGIGAVALGRSEWFDQFMLSRRVGPEALAFFLWFIPNIACGLWYWSLVKKAVAATRYANR